MLSQMIACYTKIENFVKKKINESKQKRRKNSKTIDGTTKKQNKIPAKVFPI